MDLRYLLPRAALERQRWQRGKEQKPPEPGMSRMSRMSHMRRKVRRLFGPFHCGFRLVAAALCCEPCCRLKVSTVWHGNGSIFWALHAWFVKMRLHNLSGNAWSDGNSNVVILLQIEPTLHAKGTASGELDSSSTTSRRTWRPSRPMASRWTSLTVAYLCIRASCRT